MADLNLTLGPDDRCLAHTVGTGLVSGTFNDLGRITIPRRSADNTIYFLVNRVIDNEFRNTFANEIPTFFRFSPRLTIESTALNDPGAVDANGNPLNGVLIRAIIGAADGDELRTVTEHVANVGLLFQITDDLLDVTQTSEVLGKTAGKDERAEKAVYPSIFGVEETQRWANIVHCEAIGALQVSGFAGSSCARYLSLF